MLSLKLEAEHELSKDLKERAKGFLEVTLFGATYEIPVTKEMRKLLGIRGYKGQVNIPNNLLLSKMLRDIINAIYLQMRDTVGTEIHQKLSSQVSDFLLKKIDEPLQIGIEKEIDQRLPKE